MQGALSYSWVDEKSGRLAAFCNIWSTVVRAGRIFTGIRMFRDLPQICEVSVRVILQIGEELIVVAALFIFHGEEMFLQRALMVNYRFGCHQIGASLDHREGDVPVLIDADVLLYCGEGVGLHTVIPLAAVQPVDMHR